MYRAGTVDMSGRELSACYARGRMRWTKKRFKKEFGEDPEDLFGPDWENYLEAYEQANGEGEKSNVNHQS